MNHELAQELKDAGFPQRNGIYFVGDPQRLDLTIKRVNGDYVAAEMAYRPTLEELIERCGSGFKHLARDSENNWSSPSWAPSYPTPSEAVARLWLALNKKV